MNHHSHVNCEARIPEGFEFFRATSRIVANCDHETDEYLQSEFRRGSITTHDHLGTLVSLLDRASSCWWGCHGGDHAGEYILGRCCAYGMSAFRLARSGAYDESLALSRTIWEATNLAVLFVADPTEFENWKRAKDRDCKDKYSPVNVRIRLEQSQFRHSIISQKHYAFLCTKAVHLAPTLPPGMYNTARQPIIGGCFQEAGLCLCLGEIGHAFSFLGICTVIRPNPLLKLNDDKATRVVEASQALMRSLPQVWKRANASFPGLCPEPGCFEHKLVEELGHAQ